MTYRADLVALTAVLPRQPVHEIVSGAHLIADLTLDLGELVFDFLAEGEASRTAGNVRP